MGERAKTIFRFGIQTDWKIFTHHEKRFEITIKELLKFLEKGDLFLGFKPVMGQQLEQHWQKQKSNIMKKLQIQFL